MRIGIDIDDTMVEFARKFVEFHNEKYGTNVAYEDLHTYYFMEPFNISVQTAVDRVFEFFNSNYAKNIKPIEGVSDGISWLKQSGHNLFVITSRPDCFESISIKWFDGNIEGGSKAFDSIHHVASCDQDSEKYLKVDHRSKESVIKDLSLDVYIDDHHKKLAGISEMGVITILFTRTWNKDKELLPNMYRADSWNDIVRIIEDLDK